MLILWEDQSGRAAALVAGAGVAVLTDGFRERVAGAVASEAARCTGVLVRVGGAMVSLVECGRRQREGGGRPRNVTLEFEPSPLRQDLLRG